MKEAYLMIVVLGAFLLIGGCLGSDVAPSNLSNHLPSPADNQTKPHNCLGQCPESPNNLAFNSSIQNPTNSTNFSIQATSIPNASSNPTSNLTNLTTNPLSNGTRTNSTSAPSDISSANLSTSACPPESCTDLDWKTRARLLDIPDYQKETSPDGKLILHSGKIQVVLPDDSPSAEEFGRIQLYGLRRSYNNTESLLGRPPFAQPDIIKEEFVLNLSNTGECCGPVEEGLPLYWNAGDYTEYQQMINLGSPDTRYLQTGNWSEIFNGNHELTHRFVRGLDLSQFVDEGLAMYAQDHGDPQPMTCGQGGYEQNGQFYPYTFLCTNDEGMDRIYKSGDCFWQRVEDKYGPGMVKSIIARMYNKEERDAMRIYYPTPDSPTVRWHSFSGQLLIDLQQAFVPEIGDRFWDDFSDFGFSANMADGQTYDSELVSAHCQ